MKRAVKKWIWKGPKLESSLWERVVPGRSEEGTTFGSLGILGGFWFLWWIDEGGFWILGSWNEMTFRERSYIVRRGYRISHLSSRTQISLCAIITEPKTSLPSAPLSVHHSPLCSSLLEHQEQETAHHHHREQQGETRHTRRKRRKTVNTHTPQCDAICATQTQT